MTGKGTKEGEGAKFPFGFFSYRDGWITLQTDLKNDCLHISQSHFNCKTQANASIEFSRSRPIPRAVRLPGGRGRSVRTEENIKR